MANSAKPAAISPAPTGRFIDLGSVVADWIEANLVHGEGDYYGRPWVLEPWQRTFIRRLYLVDADTRRRIVRRALLILPKGNGKTELIAAIMLAELAGPTTVDEVGRPVLRDSPNIPIAAASYEQSDRLFGAAKAMAEHEDAAVRPFLTVGEHKIRRKSGPGEMFRIAAVAGTNDGGLPTAFGADEVHEWTGKKRRVHLIISNSLTKREEGLELNISTPDDAQPDSLLGTLVAYGERVASGEVEDPSFLYVHYSAKGRYDLVDSEELRKEIPDDRERREYLHDQAIAAVRESNPASWLNPERIAQRLTVDAIPLYEFERYHLARFVRPSRFWLPAGFWENLATERPKPPDGAEVVLGFDGSYGHDSTGVVGCTMDGYLWVEGAWERPEKAPPGWSIPRSEVDAVVHRSMRRWKVREFVCDPHRWTQEIQDWQETYGDTIVEFPTNTISRMSPACARFYGAVVSGDGLTHDGDPRLQRHLYNAVTKEHRDGAYITKESRDSPRKIDLAIAAVIAYERAMVLKTHRPRRSAYADHGLMIVGGRVS